MEIGFGSNVNLIFQTLKHAHYSPVCAEGSHFITSERIINDENLSSKFMALTKFIREQEYDTVTITRFGRTRRTIAKNGKFTQG